MRLLNNRWLDRRNKNNSKSNEYNENYDFQKFIL